MTRISRYPSQPDLGRTSRALLRGVAQKIHAGLRLLGREDSNLRLADPESANNCKRDTTDAPHEVLGNHGNADGAAGTPPDESADILTIEDRLLIAVAARGNRDIGEFIYDAIWNARFLTTLRDSDEEFVAALEREAFG